jgi:arginine/lysine/ornithine decarboxylase
MGLFGSTSPSYLIMASLDYCNKYISERIRGDIAAGIEQISLLRSRFSGRLLFTDGDPFHITVRASESGISGIRLAELIRENGCECEYSDSDLAVLLMSPVNTAADYSQLSDALEKSLRGVELIPREAEPFPLPLPESAMSVREAVFAQSETISVDEAVGRICGAVEVPCPPAIPIAVSGEVISRECVNIFKRYGISEVNVVK